MQAPSSMPQPEGWEKCSSCKKVIPWGAKWYKCSVSTCNRVRFHLQFCSVDCWDAHVPGQNHRSAHCTEQTAPKKP
ncbi:hypothetical protein EBR78_01260 [bacterium]|nr:hypothetical protein [bacterium]NBX82622.1 hypothetical protein [bacterium]